jgi:hypothetical protein
LKIKVTIKRSAVSELVKAQQEALYHTVQIILNDALEKQTIPYDSGRLESHTFLDIQGSKARLISDTPYASRVYFSPFSEKGEWWGKWMNIIRTKKLYKREFKGIAERYVK